MLRAAGDRRHPELSQTPIHWFRVGREAPIHPYERLILGYRSLAPEAKRIAEHVVDEFFSEEEFRLPTPPAVSAPVARSGWRPRSRARRSTSYSACRKNRVTPCRSPSAASI
jgi:hypothetical protein